MPNHPHYKKPGPRLPVLDLLSNRDFRTLWTTSWAWHTGRWAWMVASGYLVLQLTDSTFQTQLVGVAFFSSMLFGGVLSGVVADAFDRRAVLIFSHVFDLLVLGTTVFLVYSGQAQGWHIIALSALYGIPHTLDMATRRNFALDIVGRKSISHANALEGMSMMAAGSLGPFFAGWLIDVLPLGKSADAAASYFFIIAI